MDERAETDDAGAVSEEAEPSGSYHDDALPEHQARITELLPARALTMFAWAIGLILVIAGIEAGYAYRLDWAAKLGVADITALNVTASASIGTWFSAVSFLAAGMFSMLVYALRRHRQDDYRGGYRVWAWTAAFFFLSSLDVVAGISQTLGALLAIFAGGKFVADSIVWRTILCGVLGSALCIRMSFELVRSKLAMTCMALTVGLYAIAISAPHGLFDTLIPSIAAATAPLAHQLLVSSAMLGGHAACLFTILLYGRHVLLDMQGKVKAKDKTKTRRKLWPKMKRKPKSEKGKPAELRVDPAHQEEFDDAQEKPKPKRRRTTKKKTRIDPPQETATGDPEVPKRKQKSKAQQSKPQSRAQSSTQQQSSQEEADGEEPVRKMSKAERRRLRKQQRMARNDAA